MILAVRTKRLGGRRPHVASPRRAIIFFLDNDRGLDPRPKLWFLLYLNPNLVENMVSSRGGSGWVGQRRGAAGSSATKSSEGFQVIGRHSDPSLRPSPPLERRRRNPGSTTSYGPYDRIDPNPCDPGIVGQTMSRKLGVQVKAGARDLLLVSIIIPGSSGASGGDDVRGSLGAPPNFPPRGQSAPSFSLPIVQVNFVLSLFL